MKSIWKVDLSRDAKKRYRTLSFNGKKPSIIDVIDSLIIDLQKHGPQVINWPNYGIINQKKGQSYHHCHLRKGRPTFVACWTVDEKNEKIEVFYVGTHEDAPY